MDDWIIDVREHRKSSQSKEGKVQFINMILVCQKKTKAKPLEFEKTQENVLKRNLENARSTEFR